MSLTTTVVVYESESRKWRNPCQEVEARYVTVCSNMIGERETNGIESAKMITWVSVCKKSEKCSAYSKVSTTPMEFDLPPFKKVFGWSIPNTEH